MRIKAHYVATFGFALAGLSYFAKASLIAYAIATSPTECRAQAPGIVGTVSLPEGHSIVSHGRADGWWVSTRASAEPGVLYLHQLNSRGESVSTVKIVGEAR